MISEKKTINSVVKSLNILECFSHEVKELKLTEIAKILDMPKSTTSNLVYTLMKMGYIDQNHDNGKFRLGTKLFMLGKVFEYHTNTLEVAKPYMEMLRNKYNESVQLAIPYDNYGVIEGICVEKIEGYSVIDMNSKVGKNFPLHCTAAGKLFLAAMSQESLERTLENMDLFKRTEYSITDVDTLRKEIKDIKEKGYSLAIEENALGITSVAAPIYNYSGDLVASILIAAPTVRISGDVKEQIIQELLKASRSVSEKLGYR